MALQFRIMQFVLNNNVLQNYRYFYKLKYCRLSKSALKQHLKDRLLSAYLRNVSILFIYDSVLSSQIKPLKNITICITMCIGITIIKSLIYNSFILKQLI
ncbi:hypothetical protein QTP88_022316 [Uroleucon formosanum]